MINDNPFPFRRMMQENTALARDTLMENPFLYFRRLMEQQLNENIAAILPDKISDEALLPMYREVLEGKEVSDASLDKVLDEIKTKAEDFRADHTFTKERMKYEAEVSFPHTIRGEYFFSLHRFTPDVTDQEAIDGLRAFIEESFGIPLPEDYAFTEDQKSRFECALFRSGHTEFLVENWIPTVNTLLPQHLRESGLPENVIAGVRFTQEAVMPQAKKSLDEIAEGLIQTRVKAFMAQALQSLPPPTIVDGMDTPARKQGLG